MRRITLLAGLAIVLATFCIGGSCDKSTSEQEQQKQSQSYEDVVAHQPARGMSYSPTRDTLNKWAATWEEEGKLSYVYLIDSVGHEIGYYVFTGLPVSYCASLTPPDKYEYHSGAGVLRTAPAIDGVYYAAGNCQQMFGYDATSGAYMEFTGGGSFNYLLSDQPMTEIDTKPLGDTTIEEAKKLNK